MSRDRTTTSLMGRRRRRFAITAGVVVAALVAIPVVVNQLTPRPYALLLRTLIGTIESSVTLGPLASRAESIRASDPIPVPVEGAPDASMTIYASDEAVDGGKPTILLVHGGGWVLGAAAQIGDYAALLASEGFVVANLDYSLAPEHEYPVPVLQAGAALDLLHARAPEFGGDPTSMFLAGNSAGAQIAGQVAAVVTNTALAREMGVELGISADHLRGVVLFSGPYDLHTVGRTNFPGFLTYAWSYLGRRDYERDPRLDQLSITRSATAGYPATYLTTGDADPLEPQTYELDAVLRELGVDVTSRYWTGSGAALPHDYVFDVSTPEGRTALDDLLGFVRQHAGAGD